MYENVKATESYFLKNKLIQFVDPILYKYTNICLFYKYMYIFNWLGK